MTEIFNIKILRVARNIEHQSAVLLESGEVEDGVSRSALPPVTRVGNVSGETCDGKDVHHIKRTSR